MKLNEEIIQIKERGCDFNRAYFTEIATSLLPIVRLFITGLANSTVGFLVIIICLFFGASGFTANVAGFAFGLACSFLLNRHYVFGLTGAISYVEIIRFMAVFGAAYGVNMLVLLQAQLTLGEGSAVAQLLAVAAYTLAFYPLSRFFVFKPTALAE